MELVHWVLFGVLPALAAVLVFVGAGGPRFLSLALAVAVCVPFGMAIDWPAWFWQLDVGRGDALHWLWWTFAAAGAIGAAYDLRLLPKPLLLAFEVLVIAMLPWFASSRLRAGWSFERCVLVLGAAWLVLAALWWVLRAAGKVRPGASVPLAGAIALTADALVLRAQGSTLAWHLAGVSAVTLWVSVATTLWRRPFVCGTGGTLCVTVVHAGVLWCGRSERELLGMPGVLCLLAPLAMGLAVTKYFADGRTTGLAVGVAACAAVGATAVAMA